MRQNFMTFLSDNITMNNTVLMDGGKSLYIQLSRVRQQQKFLYHTVKLSSWLILSQKEKQCTRWLVSSLINSQLSSQLKGWEGLGFLYQHPLINPAINMSTLLNTWKWGCLSTKQGTLGNYAHMDVGEWG